MESKFMFHIELHHDENYRNYQVWAVFKWGIEVIGRGLTLKDAEESAMKWISDNAQWAQKEGELFWRKTK